MRTIGLSALALVAGLSAAQAQVFILGTDANDKQTYTPYHQTVPAPQRERLSAPVRGDERLYIAPAVQQDTVRQAQSDG